MQKKFKEAEPVAKECIAIRERDFPNYWRTFNMKRLLGESLQGQQKYDEAEPVLLAAYEGLKKLEDKIPVESQQWVNDSIQDIIRLYEVTGRPAKVTEWKTELIDRYKKKLAQLRKAAENGNPQGLNRVAWFLATCTEAAVRNGPDAVAYAEKAVTATNRKDAGILDTLAAAYAESGEFAKAVSIEKEALALTQNESLKNDLETHLKLYESNTPYRER
jgi:TPR repeat protein